MSDDVCLHEQEFPLCGRCLGAVHPSQGVVHLGYSVAHMHTQDCIYATEQRMRAWQAFRDWLDGTAEWWRDDAESYKDEADVLRAALKVMSADARLMARALDDMRATDLMRTVPDGATYTATIAAIERHLEAGR